MADSQKTSSSDSPFVCPVRKARAELGSPNPVSAVEILREGQECPFCHFAELKRDGNEIVCPICGYGRKPCT